MRQHLSSLIGNETRLVGGSSDTVYFPRGFCVYSKSTSAITIFTPFIDRYYASMKEILGLFLETNCFLEIALPTVIHLIVHPGDHIQFVDHVRILFTSVACHFLSFI
jgi:hypothetical protein